MNTEGVHIPRRGHEDVERPDQGRAESCAAGATLPLEHKGDSGISEFTPKASVLSG